ncbi:MAG: hypothetical protein GX260_03170 [Tissierellia bacterium]|nr:hypothetical protein [Tissierellia bacterium]
MTRKELREAIDTLTPDRETKREMFLAIEEKASKPVLVRWPKFRRAAVVALAVLLLAVAVPGGIRFVIQARDSIAMGGSDVKSEEADIVSACQKEAVAADVNTEEVFSAENIDVADELKTAEYDDGEFQIVEIEGVEDLDALIHLLPEEASIIESEGTFRKYKVGEEIWEIRIERGNTRLIRPLNQ